MKFKWGDSVIIKVPNSNLYNVEGKIIEFTDKPYNMYIVRIYDGIRVGIAEEYLYKVRYNFGVRY